MRYGGRLNRIEFTALIDQRANRIRASAAALPLYGMAGWSGPCRIGAWTWDEDRLVHAGLTFGDPAAGGGWVEVVTTAGPPLPLLIDMRVAAVMPQPPEDRKTYERNLRAASTPAPHRVGITVDGVPKPFQRWPDQQVTAGQRGWLAVLDEVPGLLLRVSNLAPAEIGLARVGDLEPHLVGTRTQLLAGYDDHAEDPAPS
ncbi:hypothetical protein ACQEVZ_36515 [Dactylosporangium sp. CA-152071]|uniref:hypothetical protein n=1 Tax=Dactylosporangium sp. CA-152071 TaxID=3239933 RepID=UPI003D9370BE